MVSQPLPNENYWDPRQESRLKPSPADLSQLWKQPSQISADVWCDQRDGSNSVSSSSSLFYSPQESLGNWEWPSEDTLNPFPSAEDAIRLRSIGRPRTSTMPETRMQFAHSRARSGINPLGESWATPPPHPAVANRAISGTNHGTFVPLNTTYAQKYSSQGSTSWSNVAASRKSDLTPSKKTRKTSGHCNPIHFKTIEARFSRGYWRFCDAKTATETTFKQSDWNLCLGLSKRT
jgi:hypothetical protein